MEITGNLKSTQLAEVLQWLAQGEKTGALVVDNAKVQKKIFLEAGRIVTSSSTEPSERLGHFLVGHGFITEEELGAAMEMQAASSMMLGKILVTVGGITEEALQDLLVDKAEESIYSLFSWPEGEFRFVEGETLERGMVPISLDVTAIVLEGIRRLDEWNRIRESIPSVAHVPVAVEALEEIGAEPRESRILGLVDNDRTVKEISLQSHASEFVVCEILFRHVSQERIKIVRPRQRPEPSGKAAKPAEVLNAAALLQKAERHLDNGAFRRALRNFRAARSLEPDNQAVLDRVVAAEKSIRQSLEAQGLEMTAIPRLNRTVEELTEFQLSPEEGFVISRITGQYDLRSILKISPLDQLDCHLIFRQLIQDRHITLEPPD